MPSITIIDTTTIAGDEFIPASILAQITITDDVNTYLWSVGGIPVDTVDVQAYLDARFDAIWRGASQQQTTAQQTALQVAKLQVKDNITLARDYSADIITLFNAILQQTINQTAQPTRYNNIRAVMDGASTAFRNRFNTDLLNEVGIDAATISTDSQRRNYCLYARLWVGLLVDLLTEAV